MDFLLFGRFCTLKIVEVYFVDFGNTEKLDARDVLALPAEFGDIETQVNITYSS